MDRFEEAKIKLVMNLKKLTRKAAVEEIARMAEERRKAAEEAALARKRSEEDSDLEDESEEEGFPDEDSISADEFFSRICEK